MDKENGNVKEKFYFVPYYTNGSGFWGLLLYFVLEKLFKGKSLRGFLRKSKKSSLIFSLFFLLFLFGWFSFSILIPSLEVSNITLDEILKNEISQEKLILFKSAINERSSFFRSHPIN